VKRREFITLLGGAASWPLVAHGERSKRPIRDLSGTARTGHDPSMMSRDG
jgi:hypothetical protein